MTITRAWRRRPRQNRSRYSDGQTEHRLVYEPDSGLSAETPRDPAAEASCRAFLEAMLNDGTRRLSEVRRRFLEWQKA